jgi:hypothetical protein
MVYNHKTLDLKNCTLVKKINIGYGQHGYHNSKLQMTRIKIVNSERAYSQIMM